MNTTKIRIVSRWNSATVLFECDLPEGLESSLAMRHALEKAVESGANLSDANMRGANMSGANLSDAYLSGANLSDANLRGAYLSGANLRDAYLSGANLSDAYLSGANLSDANLSGANMSGANLSDAYLRGANLSGANMSGANLSDAYLRGANMSDAYLLTVPVETQIERLDKVREIILDDAARLEMGVWHEDDAWKGRTCAEETLCGTSHCLAGWLQVCSTDPEIRKKDPEFAGYLSAPVAAPLFFSGGKRVLEWLRDREYVQQLEAAKSEAAS